MKSTVPSPPAETGKSVSWRWQDLLAEAGYRPQLQVADQDPERSRLFFKSEGEPHYLYLHEQDPEHFRLSLRFLLGDQASAPDFALLAAANEQNRLTKLTKVSVDLEDRSACFDVEGLVEAPPSAAILERMLFQCGLAARRFFARLRGSSRPTTLAC